jgi:Leucine-rich repeat (LRR) protein
MKIENLLFTAMASIAFIGVAYTQNVTIPDANFKAALVNNSIINTNMDADIQISEASVFNGAINVSQLNITDLTGIEVFVLLDSLDCSRNQIAGLDVSSNLALTYLNCSGNMESWSTPQDGDPFDFDDVFIYYLDTLNVSANAALTTLICNHNGLLGLNTSGLTSLTYLDCSDNQRLVALDPWTVVTISILTFDFLSNVALIYLDCGRNELPSLDVSGNTLLNYLDCSWNKLPNLDVSGNTFLTTLNCRYNSLTSLNVSVNTELTNLDCRSNSVIGFSPEGWQVSMPSLQNLNVSANLALTTLNCGYNSLTSLNVSACTALITLDCSMNGITSLDFSSNTALTTLACSYNTLLTSIDLSANIALTHLECYTTGLTSLDVSANIALADLGCSYDNWWGISQLTILNVSGCTALTYLICEYNQISTLDVSSNIALTLLSCHNNQLTSLNVKNGNSLNNGYLESWNNLNLSCIEVDSVEWSTANWANTNTASFSENCSGVGITVNNESTAPMFYPNPTTGNLFITEKADISLRDLSGKLLLEEKNTNQLDISALPAGMYFLSFGENKQQTFKVIKE